MQTQNNSHCAGLTKQGDDHARQLANQYLIKAIALSGGLGLLGGAGLGLGKMLTEDKPYSPDPSYQPVDIVVPKKKQAPGALPKMAAASLTTKLAEGKPEAAGVFNQVADAIYPHLPKEGLPGWFFGNGASSPYTVPALLGLGLPLAGAAAYGGMNIGRGIVDWRRKADLDSQLKRKQDEYKAFVEQNLAHKHASDAEVERELDELADLYEKNALVDPKQIASDAGGIGTGLYTAYALAAALGAGKLSYDYFKKRSPEKIQEEALRQRAIERHGGAKPIYLSPVEEQVE